MTNHSDQPYANEYVKPELVDFGSLVELTQATVFQGPEDGAMKIELIIPHHSIL